MLVISEISRSISASLDLNTTLSAILTNLGRLVEFEVGEVCLWNPDYKQLRPVGRSGDKSYHVQLDELGGYYTIDDGYSGWIARHHQSLVIGDINKRTDIRPKLDLQETSYNSYIGLPLMVRNRFIGTLELISDKHNAYDADDLSLLNIVADQAAIAIENARLYSEQEGRVTELTGLQEISSALSALQDPYQLFAQLTERIASLMQVETCAVLLYDADTQTLKPQIPVHGVPDGVMEMYRIPVTEGTAAGAFWKETPFWFSNNIAHETLVEELGLQGIATAVGVYASAIATMTIGNERIGVVQISNKLDRSAFDMEDIRLLQVYAAQAAIVVENARLYGDEQNRVAELQGLQQISQAVSALTTRQELYAQLSERIGELMDVELCGILIYEPETATLAAQLPFFGVDSELIQHYRISLPEGSKARDIWQNKDIHISNDVANDPMATEIGLDQIAAIVGVHSTIFVPLSTGGRRFGSIQVSNKNNGTEFNQDDARILSIFASQASALLENARLYEATDDNLRNRIEELRSVSRVSRELNATLELERILQVISDEAIRAEGATCGNVIMMNWDEAQEQANISSRFGCGSNQLGQLELEVLRTGEVITIEDFNAIEDIMPPHEGVRSALVVPINFEGAVVGVIELHSDKPGILGMSSLEFVSALAHQAAIAVGNASRNADQVERGELLRRRAEQLTQIFELGRLFRTDQSVEDSLNAMAQGIRSSAGFNVVIISTVDERGKHLERIATAGLLDSTASMIGQSHIPVKQVEILMQDKFAISGSYYIPHGAEERKNGMVKDWVDKQDTLPIKAGRWHPHDLLLLPLHDKVGTLTGTLIVDTPVDGLRPNQATAETLEIFADQAAVIIENSRLYHSMEDRAEELSKSLETLEVSYNELDELSRDMVLKDLELSHANERLEKRARRLLALHRVMESIDTTQAPDRVLTDVTEAVVREMGVDVCILALEQLDNGQATLVPVASAGKVPDDIDIAEYMTDESPLVRSYASSTELLLNFEGNGRKPPALVDALEIRSLITLPIDMGPDNRGAMLIGNRNISLAEEDVDLFKLLSNQLAVEFENARLYEAVRDEANSATLERDQLQHLHLVTTALQQTRSLDERLKTIASGLKSLNFGQIAVILFDEALEIAQLETAGYNASEESNLLERLPSSGDDWSELFQDPNFLQHSIGTSIFLPHDDQWVQEHFNQSKTNSATSRTEGRWHTDDLLLLPLYVAERPIGLISLSQPTDDTLPTSESLRPLELFAQQAASALDNTRLYQDTLELQSFNEAVVESIQQGIMVLAPDQIISLANNFMRALHNPDHDLVGSDFATSFADWHNSGLSDDIVSVQSDNLPREHQRVRYERPDGSTALLNIFIYPLSVEENQAGTVILVDDVTSHSQLEEDVAVRGQQLAALSEVSRIITSTLSIDDVIKLVMEEVDQVLTFDNLTLWLRDTENDDALSIVAAYGFDNHEEMLGQTVNFDDSQLFSDIAASRQTLAIGDTHSDQRFDSDEEGDTQSWLGVPLISQDNIVGLIAAEKNEANFYAPADAQVAIALANQAAIALENARLYQQVSQRAAELDSRTQRLALLNRVSAGLGTTLELDNILRLALEEMVAAIGGEQGEVLLIDLDSERASVAAIHPPDSKHVPNIEILVEGSSLLEHLSETLTALVSEDAQNDPLLASIAYLIKERNTHSTCIVPLVISGQLAGTMNVTTTEPHHFEPEQVELAQAMANQVAVAIANARLFEETAERTRELEILFASGQAASSSLELDHILTGMGSFLTEAIPIEGYTISLWDQEENTLITLFDSANPGQDTVEQKIEHSLANLHTARQVLEDRQTATLYASDDNAKPEEQAWLTNKDIQASLMLPLITRGTTVGLLELWHTSAEYQFTASDRRLGQAIANQTATAIENARLHDETEQRVDELRTINQIGRAITSAITAEDLYETLYQQIGSVVGAKSMVIALHETITNSMTFPLSMRDGVPEPLPSHTFGSGIYSYIVTNKTPLLLNGNVRNLGGQLGLEGIDPNLKSFLAIPFFSAERAIGTLAVLDYETENAFDKIDQRILETTAAQVAVSIQNARLYDQLQQRLGETTALQEVSRVVNSSLDISEIFDRVVDELTYAFEYPMLGIFTTENDKLVLRANHGYSDEVKDKFDQLPITKGILGRVARTGQPTFIVDVTTEKEYIRTEDWVVSKITVPISTDEDILGVVNIEAGADRPLVLNDMVLLTTLAGQIATAISNARLYDQMLNLSSELEERVDERTRELQEERDSIDTLYRITSELSASLDLDRVLNRALELVGQAIGAEHGSLFLVDPQSERLIYRAVMSDYEVLPPGGRQIALTRHEGMAGWVMDNREALLLDNVQDDPRWVNLPGTESRRSMLAAPLIANEEVLGVVIMMSDVLEAFTESQLRLVEAAANQVASSINNAELYRLIRDQAERLGAMLRSQQVEASKSQAILEGIADGVMVSDAAGEIILFNAAAERILDFKRDEMLGRPTDQLTGLYGSSAQNWANAITRWTEDPTTYNETELFQERLEMGSKVISVYLSPVTHNNEFLGLVSLFRDITREVEVDRIKSDFVATVSHELRTPMTSIKGYADLLLMGAAGNLTEDQINYLEIIRGNADRLSLLVNDLLDISRIEQGRVELELVDLKLKDPVGDILDTLDVRFGEDPKVIHLAVSIPEDLPTFEADQRRITQILLNLVLNAYQYTPDGGSVIINAEVESEGVRIDIIDTGIGITSEDHQQVFDRFFRGEDPIVMATAGTGLGLSIVQNLVDMHNGRIWLESEPGEGTTFSVFFPFTQQQLQQVSA